jgi:hypothetical protein
LIGAAKTPNVGSAEKIIAASEIAATRSAAPLIIFPSGIRSPSWTNLPAEQQRTPIAITPIIRSAKKVEEPGRTSGREMR